MTIIDFNANINARNARQWSPLQEVIFEALTETDRNIIVEAVAGSGKTTTMIEAMHRIVQVDQFADILALAFNKSIATELSLRVPEGVTAKTFHALGYSTFKGKRPKVFGGKVRKLLRNIMTNLQYEEHSRDIIRMISLVKANALFDPSEADWLAALDDFDINCPAGEEKNFVKWASTAFQQSNDVVTEEIDFDDMLFLPVLRGHRFNQYDYVFVDEAQDLSPIQHEIVARVLAPNGRVIAVGDTHQAIYGFRGADVNSMNRFRNCFNTLELPLSITYRCPVEVVQEAREMVDTIEWAPGAPKGTVEYMDEFPRDFADMTKDDLIICRNNAPLFRIGLAFLSRQLPVTVMGNFGDRLIAFIKSFKTEDIEVFESRLDKWFNTEYERLMENDQSSKAGVEEDKYECVKILIEHSSTVPEMIKLLERLLTPGAGTVVSSVHRAKGTEAKRVYILNPSLIPSRYAKSPAARQQEWNLKYVAITRAKEELYYVEEGK